VQGYIREAGIEAAVYSVYVCTAKLELVIKKRRLRCLGDLLRMGDSRIPRQAMQCELNRAITRESRDGQGKTGRTSSDEI